MRTVFFSLLKDRFLTFSVYYLNLILHILRFIVAVDFYYLFVLDTFLPPFVLLRVFYEWTCDVISVDFMCVTWALRCFS